tara:strand:+ start:174 stop:629 length:456 start_codon:yes stop_codon:yes gene_type:complete
MAKLFFPISIFSFLLSCAGNIDLESKKSPHQVHEMRIYYTHEGKFNDILSRFENHTTKLFEKHGFLNVGYWTSIKVDSVSYADKFLIENKVDSTLVYIVSFKDMKSRNKAWDNFIKDPEWIKVFNESRVNGPIVKEIEQVFLSPTSFSNLK